MDRFKINPFEITIEYKHHRYTMTVTQIRLDVEKETFKVSNGNAIKFLESYRPKAKRYGNMNAYYEITLAQGQILKNKAAFDLVIAEIKTVLDYYEQT